MAVYILLFIIVFGEGLLISSMGAVVFVLTLTGCERDDRNKTDLLWNSLPIARWKIVAAKYLSSLAYALLTIPVYWLISVAFSRSSLAIAPISGADLVSGLGMAMLLVGLTLPVFFLPGVTGRQWAISVFWHCWGWVLSSLSCREARPPP